MSTPPSVFSTADLRPPSDEPVLDADESERALAALASIERERAKDRERKQRYRAERARLAGRVPRERPGARGPKIAEMSASRARAYAPGGRRARSPW